MKLSCLVLNFFELHTIQQMPYYMNGDKLDRYMFTRPRNMSKKRVKPVLHYSVRKSKAREFHGSGLISNHVNFALDVEVSTIAKKSSIMKSRKQRAKRCIIWMCFPSNMSSSSFESDFGGEVGELAEVAPYDKSFEPLATEEEAVSTNARMDQEAEQIYIQIFFLSRTNIPIIPNQKR